MGNEPKTAPGRRIMLLAGDSGGGRGLLSRVVEDLGLRILDGTYPVGEAIPTEPVLMADLKVSRTVLREAVKILIAKGLLESRTKAGTLVRQRRAWNMLDATMLRLYCQMVDYSDFAQHFQQLRLIIEPEAACLAARERSGDQLLAIEAAFEGMASAHDVESWTEADLAFHQSILEATGNPFIIPLGSLIHTALQTLLYHSATESTDPFESLAVHKPVLEAIRKRDEQGARAAMVALLDNTALAVSHVIEVEHAR